MKTVLKATLLLSLLSGVIYVGFGHIAGAHGKSKVGALVDEWVDADFETPQKFTEIDFIVESSTSLHESHKSELYSFIIHTLPPLFVTSTLWIRGPPTSV
jgi:hypothetical protein